MGDYDDSLFWDSMDDETVDQVLGLLADEEVEVTGVPRSGLVMLTAKDSFDTDFHLGEVLVTDARVTCFGVEGFGMVVGEHPRKALARAAADAVIRCEGASAVKDKLMGLIISAQAERRKQLLEHQTRIAATQVNFDLM